VCQDVCPWNHNTAGEPVPFPQDPGLEFLDPVELLGLDEAAFRARFKPTSLWRPRRAGLLRNAAVVLGNVGDERALTDKEEVIREAAAWAIGRIRERMHRGLGS
jgi:epoxyqueuosine reductase